MFESSTDVAIADLDGFLLNTEIAYDRVFAEYARIRGCPEEAIAGELPALRRQMFGRKKEESARLFLLGMKIIPQDASEEVIKKEAELWFTWREPQLLKLFRYADPMPGARQLIERLTRQGNPLAIATSSDQKLWQVKSERHPWLCAISVVVTGDQVKRGKPAPDLFLTAAERLHADVKNCIVMEDAINGVEAALAASMRALYVPIGEPDETEILRLKQQYPEFAERVTIRRSLLEI